MARLILHIGAHKTGTSYLQRILHRNRDLLAKNGVIYPDLGPNPAHHILAAPWIDMPEIEPHWFGDAGAAGLWKRFIADMAGHDGPVILSAEPFSRVAPQAVDLPALAALCAAFESVTIVYVVRHQVELAQSIWLQRAKTSGAPPVERFVEHALSTGLASGISLDHLEIYQRLLEAFPCDSIRLADYHHLRRQAGGLLGGFCRLAGLDLPLSAFSSLPTSEANISPDPLASLIARRLTLPDVPDRALLKWVGERVQKRYGAGKNCIFNWEEINRLDQKFAKSNQLLEEAYHAQDAAFSITPTQTDGWLCRDDLTWEIWTDMARSFYHAA
ncbi:MAG: hypothetical protein ABNH26_02980 [Celeribacter sp.]|jgi:hypothetical protein